MIQFLFLDQFIAAAAATAIRHRLRKADERRHTLPSERRDGRRDNVRQGRTATRST